MTGATFQRSRTCRFRRRAAALVPLKAVADIGFGAGLTTIQRTNQIRRTAVGADLAPGIVSGDVWPKINQLPTLQHLPQGVQKLDLGDQKWQSELVYYFVMALLAGILLVFAVLVLLYRRFLAPFVNMVCCRLPRSARPSACTLPGSQCRCRCSSAS